MRTSRLTPASPQASPDAAIEAPQHDFARFIRIIGRGPSLSRPLTQEEARNAMAMILAGDVAPEQLGAMMIVLRFRKETPDELAGFVEASRGVMVQAAQGEVMLDWPSYTDRHKQLPYFVLAAIGIEASADADAATRRLDANNIAYLPLERFCPQLLRLFALRPVLGLRSPANTFARMLNPFGARH